jgi:hypothetical protein
MEGARPGGGSEDNSKGPGPRSPPIAAYQTAS